MSWRITHVDSAGVRRRLHLQVANRVQALASVESIFGLGWYVAAVRVGGAV